MPLIIVLFRVALSAVFGVAGVTKLLDLQSTRKAIKNFGAPYALVPTLSIILPILELTVAAGLLVSGATSISAAGALVLLGVFIVAIGVNLAQGRTHDCHCFGQLHSRPLGWQTLVRNLIFALGAGFVLWQTRKSVTPPIIPSLVQLAPISQLLLGAAVVGTVVVLIYLRRRNKKKGKAHAATAESSPEGLPPNSIAPAFELPAYHGGSKSLTELIALGKPILLIFTSPTCGPCVWLFQEIKDWERAHSDQLTIGLISRGTIKENFVNVARNGLGEVLLQEKNEVATQYMAQVTPTAVVVDTSGRIASPLAAGADQIRNLLHTVLGNSSDPVHLQNHSH
jgi:thiol-disulfide isomerase/thioredoxin